jgi:DNA end-binding protein Ku
MEGSWDPKRYRDTHRQKVEALIEEKSQGKQIVANTGAPVAKVVDLMDALNASIKAAVQTETPTKSGRPKVSASAKKAPAKRPSVSATAAKKDSKPAPARTARRKAS